MKILINVSVAFPNKHFLFVMSKQKCFASAGILLSLNHPQMPKIKCVHNVYAKIEENGIYYPNNSWIFLAFVASLI